MPPVEVLLSSRIQHVVLSLGFFSVGPSSTNLFLLVSTINVNDKDGCNAEEIDDGDDTKANKTLIGN
jgi:hypothetical protein